MTSLTSSVDAVATPAPPRPRYRRALPAVLGVAAFVGLFFSYYAMSRTQTMNADGASIALQAWDLLHGNLLLGGWVTDVPFYFNELLVLAGAEVFLGLDGNVVHVCAAFEHTMLTFLVAFLARAGTRGRTAIIRVGIAFAVMLVPQHGLGISVLLLSPDHTGTTVFLLGAILVIDRALRREITPRWLPYAVGGVLLIGQMSDPLVFFIGTIPMLFVCVVRLIRTGELRPWRWRGLNARLIVATLVSIVVSKLILFVFSMVSGVYLTTIPPHIASPKGFVKNIWIAAQCLSANFGGYFVDRDPGLDTLIGVVRLGLLLVAMAVVVATAWRLFRRKSTSDATLVDELLAYGVLVNLAAFVVSTIPADVGSARQIAPVTFLAGALVGRVVGRWLARRSSPVVVSTATAAAGSEQSALAEAAAVAEAGPEPMRPVGSGQAGLGKLAGLFKLGGWGRTGRGGLGLGGLGLAGLGLGGQGLGGLGLGGLGLGGLGLGGLGRAVGRSKAFRPVLAGVLVLAIGGEFIAQVATPAQPHEDHLVAEFLLERNLTYGLGGYWGANNITLQTGGRIRVIPVWGADGVYAFRWLSKPDWYDPTQHDARFVVIRTTNPDHGTEAGTVARFGPPVERVQISPTEIVLIYNRNLLVGLEAWCPGVKPSMAECD